MGAPHVRPAEVVEMQRLYKELGTYAAVGQKIGRSANTVARYVKMKDVPQPIRLAVQNLTQRGIEK